MLENLRLALWRHKQETGESQGKVGIKAGITETRLCLLIAGKKTATPDERKKLSEVLGIDENVLFNSSKISLEQK